MSSTIRAFFMLAVIAQVLLAASSASAEFEFTSKTYFKFYRDARDDSYAPLYEYVDFETKDTERGKWYFYFSGWWGHDFGTVAFDNRNRDELSYAFLRYYPYQDKSVLLNVGRHFVFEGVASEQIDGVSARWEFTPNTGVAFFGGSPVETAFDTRSGDSAYGGRIYLRVPYKAEIGLSFLSEDDQKARFREETGMDLWLLPARYLEIKGHSFYNNITDGWNEHTYTLRVFPSKKIVLSGLFSRTNYDDTFSASTLSVFSPDFLGPNETLTKEGGLVEYRASAGTSGVLDYTKYAYNTMGDAAYYGGKVTTIVAGLSVGASLHRMEGALEKLRYVEARVYAFKDLQDWRISVDAIHHHYDRAFDGVDNAYGVNGTVRYALSDSLTSNVSVEYAKTPDFVYSTTAWVSLVYNFKGGR